MHWDKLKKLHPKNLSSTLKNYVDEKVKAKQAEPVPDKKEQSRIPLRAITYTSRYYYNKARKIWELLLFSLPLDLLFFTITIPRSFRLEGERFYVLMLFFVSICLVSLIREHALNGIVWLDEFQEKIKKLIAKHTWIPFAAIAVLAFFEVIHRFGFDIVTVGLGVLVAVAALWKFQKTFKEQKEIASHRDADRGVWIEAMNYRVFLLTLFPLISARLVSICGVMTEILSQQGILSASAYIVAGAALLLSLEPKEQDFMLVCKRCGTKTSQALRSNGLCPRCDQFK